MMNANNSKKRVLVVDDEPGILRVVSASLGLAGYHVITTTDGEEALQLSQSQNPDVMLLDIQMQPLTGFDVLSRLRTFSQMPVVMFTARREAAEIALKEGASGFIAKPFIPGELVKIIQDVVDNKHGRENE